MSIWRILADAAIRYGGAGALAGASAFRYILSPLLGPVDAAECGMAMRFWGPSDRIVASSTPNHPCLNKLGVMADWFNPDVLTFVGAVIGMGVVWYCAKREILKGVI